MNDEPAPTESWQKPAEHRKARSTRTRESHRFARTQPDDDSRSGRSARKQRDDDRSTSMREYVDEYGVRHIVLPRRAKQRGYDDEEPAFAYDRRPGRRLFMFGSPFGDDEY